MVSSIGSKSEEASIHKGNLSWTHSEHQQWALGGVKAVAEQAAGLSRSGIGFVLHGCEMHAHKLWTQWWLGVALSGLDISQYTSRKRTGVLPQSSGYT
jgi:hypothetical protein